MSFTANDDELDNMIKGFGSIHSNIGQYSSHFENRDTQENLTEENNFSMQQVDDYSEINTIKIQSPLDEINNNIHVNDCQSKSMNSPDSLTVENLSLTERAYEANPLQWLHQSQLNFESTTHEFPISDFTEKIPMWKLDNEEDSQWIRKPHVGLTTTSPDILTKSSEYDQPSTPWLQKTASGKDDVSTCSSANTFTLDIENIALCNLIDHAKNIMESSCSDDLIPTVNNPTFIHSQCGDDNSTNIEERQSNVEFNFRAGNLLRNCGVSNEQIGLSCDIEYLNSILNAPQCSYLLARSVLRKLGTLKRKCIWPAPENEKKNK